MWMVLFGEYYNTFAKKDFLSSYYQSVIHFIMFIEPIITCILHHITNCFINCRYVNRFKTWLYSLFSHILILVVSKSCKHWFVAKFNSLSGTRNKIDLIQAWEKGLKTKRIAIIPLITKQFLC